MKKITTILVLLFTLTACSGPDWSNPDPNMPQELKARYEQTITDQLELMDENPEDTTHPFEVGYAYEQLGDYKKAVEYYEKVLDLDPDHWPALNNMAGIYEKMEEYDKAAKYIKKLYETQPDVPEVISDTVRILLKADDPDSAGDALDNYMQLQREAGKETNDAFTSDLFNSIFTYRQEHENK